MQHAFGIDGDFNLSVMKAISTLLRSPLALQDSHAVADTVVGTATVEGDIAGWAEIRKL